MIKWLKKKFEDPRSAELFYSSSASVGVQISLPIAVHGIDVGVQTLESWELEAPTASSSITTPPPSNALSSFCSVGVQADCAIDCQAVSVAFSKYCGEELGVEVSNDFLQVSASAMARLKAANRSNVVYNLAKGIGTCRTESSESRFPLERMPMGLVEYIANFFVSEDINSVIMLNVAGL